MNMPTAVVSLAAALGLAPLARAQTKISGTVAPLSSNGKWRFVGGTGALKNVRGGGPYTCRGGPEGMTCEVSGDYSVTK